MPLHVGWLQHDPSTDAERIKGFALTPACLPLYSPQINERECRETKINHLMSSPLRSFTQTDTFMISSIEKKNSYQILQIQFRCFCFNLIKNILNKTNYRRIMSDNFMILNSSKKRRNQLKSCRYLLVILNLKSINFLSSVR